MQRDFIPGTLVNILRTPPDVTHVALRDTAANFLYVMSAPDFRPTFLSPLEYVAVGSDAEVVGEMGRAADWLFAGIPGPFAEVFALRNVVSRFIEKNGIRSVGGLYPALKVDKGGIRFIGLRAEIPFGGERIEATFDQRTGRWTQRHLNSGREMPLLYPWEFDGRAFDQPDEFNYLVEAERAMFRQDED